MAKYYLTLVLFPFLPLVLGQKSDWTCGNDGYYYQNGDKSNYQCDKSKQTGNDKSGGTADKSGFTGEDKSDGGSYGWTCVNGFWKDPKGEASTHPCGDGDKLKDPEYGKTDKGEGCTVTSMRASAMTGLDRTCIAHPSYVGGRCWWTHVPSAIAVGTKVPLIVDMHGGGGCASDQVQSSGFKALADSNAAAGGGMIVVWPQGGEGGLWASQGTSNRSTSQGKGLPQWDDIGFLEQMIANIINSSAHKDKIDPERIYLSGFSLGCMMSHRFAMERSKIVAAFGCHGGELSFYPTSQTDMDADKSTYDIQPMPAYLTIGDADGWFPGANASWYAWKYWNGCTVNAENSLTSELVEHVASSCTSYTPALQTVMLVIKGGAHAPDTRAYEKAYQFMSQFKRAGAMAQLPAALPESFITNPSQSESSTSKSSMGQRNVMFAIPTLLLIVGVAST